MQAKQAPMMDTGCRPGSNNDKAIRLLRLRGTLPVAAMSSELGYDESECVQLLGFPIRQGFIRVVDHNGVSCFALGDRKLGSVAPTRETKAETAQKKPGRAVTAEKAQPLQPVQDADASGAKDAAKDVMDGLAAVLQEFPGRVDQRLALRASREHAEAEVLQVEQEISKCSGTPASTVASPAIATKAVDEIPTFLPEGPLNFSSTKRPAVRVVADSETVRFALWSDGDFVMQIGAEEIRLAKSHSIALINYVDRLAPEQ